MDDLNYNLSASNGLQIGAGLLAGVLLSGLYLLGNKLYDIMVVSENKRTEAVNSFLADAKQNLETRCEDIDSKLAVVLSKTYCSKDGYKTCVGIANDGLKHVAKWDTAVKEGKTHVVNSFKDALDKYADRKDEKSEPPCNGKFCKISRQIPCKNDNCGVDLTGDAMRCREVHARAPAYNTDQAPKEYKYQKDIIKDLKSYLSTENP